MTIRRALSLALLLALFPATAPAHARGEPQQNLNAADQARARAMVLRRSDLPRGFKTARSPAGGQDDEPSCAAADESDLTLTGLASLRAFERTLSSVWSGADVYSSLAEAGLSWERNTSTAAERCSRRALERVFKRDGLRVVSFGRRSFPNFAERSIAYRMIISKRRVRVYLDVVALQQGRAQASLIFVSALGPVRTSERARLARTVAARMTTAMRDDPAAVPAG